MVKLRAVYSKSKESIYLSHLDIMSVFERSFRRAEVPLSYTNGFTPRPEIVFASPLSVGIESTGEILEVILTEEISTSYFVREVNKVLPASITILSAEYVDMKEKNIMSRVYAAVYTIELCYNKEMFLGRTNKEIEDIKIWYKVRMEDYLNQEFILVLKKSKDRSERIDIKPLIKDYMFLFDGRLEVTIDTGSVSNLKPDMIMDGFNEYIDSEIEYNIRREKILFK